MADRYSDMKEPSAAENPVLDYADKKKLWPDYLPLPPQDRTQLLELMAKHLYAERDREAGITSDMSSAEVRQRANTPHVVQHSKERAALLKDAMAAFSPEEINTTIDTLLKLGRDGKGGNSNHYAEAADLIEAIQKTSSMQTLSAEEKHKRLASPQFEPYWKVIDKPEAAAVFIEKEAEAVVSGETDLARGRAKAALNKTAERHPEAAKWAIHEFEARAEREPALKPRLQIREGQIEEALISHGVASLRQHAGYQEMHQGAYQDVAHHREMAAADLNKGEGVSSAGAAKNAQQQQGTGGRG